MKFRKKPIVIEAHRFDGTFESGRGIIGWAHRNLPPEANSIVTHDPSSEILHIRTLEGTMLAHKGDWIIRGVKGEFYPCKPDIFAATYESAEPEAEREKGRP